MRFLYAFIASATWAAFCVANGLNANNDLAVLTLAIVYAGALAGGD